MSEASVRALDVALPLMFERVPVVESLPPLSPGMPDVRGMLEPEIRKVKQLLLNLLSNAVKFTPEGGRISLKAARRDGAVEVAVTDAGIGIAPEDQAAIFEEFRQVGTHGGRIWAESELGRGSTFTSRCR